MATPIDKGESSSTILDPYETLGLSHDATSTQIKIAYRKLALRYHPDRCQSPTQQNSSTNSSTAEEGGSSQEQSSSSTNNTNNNKDEETLKEGTDKFSRIAAAYATLSDTTKKKEYDHLYKLGAFDNHQDNNSGMNHTTSSTPQTNNYRYTENLSGGYYKPGYKPPPQSHTNPNTTHPFSKMAANFSPAQQASFAKQAAEAAFSSMQSQDSFFDDLLYSPKSNIAQQHDEETTNVETTAKGGENGNSKSTANQSTQKKKQTGIGYSFKPIGKHLSIHVPSRNEIMLNMTQAQMSNMMNNDKSDGVGGIAQGAEKHLFGTRVTFSENKTSGMSSLANMATCGLATSCIPSSTCGADTSTTTAANNNNNTNNNKNNNGIKSTGKGKEKKVISTTTRIAKGQKRIVKRTAHLYPNGTKEIVIEENGLVVRRYVEENPNTVNNNGNNGTGVDGEGVTGGSGDSQRDDNETVIPKTPPKPTKSKTGKEEEEDDKTNGGLQKEEKFTLLGLFKACYSPCSASG